MNEPGLRTFLKAANENESDSLVEYSDLVTFIDKIDDLFRKFVAFEIRGDPIAATLFINAHASFLAASRLAISGQSPPTFMALRGALESALYGLIAWYSEENRSVWLNRDRDLKRSRRLYSARNAFKLLKGDPNPRLFADHTVECRLACESRASRQAWLSSIFARTHSRITKRRWPFVATPLKFENTSALNRF
jgi:hypothetical protein